MLFWAFSGLSILGLLSQRYGLQLVTVAVILRFIYHFSIGPTLFMLGTINVSLKHKQGVWTNGSLHFNFIIINKYKISLNSIAIYQFHPYVKPKALRAMWCTPQTPIILLWQPPIMFFQIYCNTLRKIHIGIIVRGLCLWLYIVIDFC